jgi:hypothetical protein
MSPLILQYMISSGLFPGQSYIFAVSAYNAFSESAQSPLLTIIAATVPAQPAPVYRSSSGLNSIGFSWLAPDNGNSAITGYTVLSNGGSGTVFSTIGTTGAATTSFVKSGLVNG